MGWAVTLMAISWTVVGCLGIFLTAPLGPYVLIPMVGVMVLGYIFLGLFASALNGIYTAALYRYAITGDTGYFDADIMGNAFSPKK
jgi:hypothetical protein